MPDGGPNRQIYDSVFCNLFQDPKYQLEAYKAIHPEKDAVIATLKECKEKDILKEYIIEHEPEVIGIMMALYDKESYMKLYEKQKKKEGLVEGLAGLVKDGLLPISEAAKRAQLPVDEFKQEAGLVAQ